MFDPNKITYFGETDYRGEHKRFGIKAEDRTRHVYVIGKTGMGKSTLLENMAVQDIQQGNGFCFVDPHGKTADLLLEYVPEHRIKDVLYFAPFDLDFPISFNVLEDVGRDKRHLVANGLMSAFKKIWVDAWSARMEYILNNVLLALLEYPDATLVGVNRMLADKTYRKRVTGNVTDVAVKAFWEDEFAKYGERYMQEAGAAIQNKIGQFISNPLVRNIIGQPRATFDIRNLMDSGKILIVNLSKGKVGEDNANLLGSMFITKMYLGALSRADVTEAELHKLPNFYFYVDEFQSFANESFAGILSEARKYKLNLTIAHQYIEQMTEEVRAAVFGNVGTMISFRVGAFDAEVLEKEFAPQFTGEDFVNLGFAQIYLKLMIDGVSSQPFSAKTIPPLAKPEQSYKDEIIEFSRKEYARPRADVEEDLIYWHKSYGGLLSDKEKIKQAEEREQQKEEGEPQEEQISEEKDSEQPVQYTSQTDTRHNKNKKPKNKPQETHQPFSNLKELVTSDGDLEKSEEREGRLQEAILHTQENPDQKNKKKKSTKTKKDATPENKNALKDALSAILHEAKEEVKEELKEEAEVKEKKTEIDVDAKKQKAHITKEEKTQRFSKPVQPERVKAQEGPKEIPEDELKKMLEVEE